MKIVMLVGKGNSSKYMYNAIRKDYKIIKVFEENGSNKLNLLKRRLKKIGFFKVFGQIVFLMFSKILRLKTKKRMKKIIDGYRLNDEPIEKDILNKVKNINSDEVINELKRIDPDVVIVNGTSVIYEKVLLSVRAKFINTHLGITPKYRGVHGGYWAIANNDMDNCGTTVHLIDKGIDTGGILYQDTIQIDVNDNYWTYPLHQIKIGINLMLKALNDIENNRLQIVENNLESKLWYHPDIWTYTKNYLFKKVK